MSKGTLIQTDTVTAISCLLIRIVVKGNTVTVTAFSYLLISIAVKGNTDTVTAVGYLLIRIVVKGNSDTDRYSNWHTFMVWLSLTFLFVSVCRCIL